MGARVAASHPASLAGTGGKDRAAPRASSTTRRAISARATRAPAAIGIRLTRRPSFSTTTTPRCCQVPGRPSAKVDDLIVAVAEPGICRVICFSASPRPDGCAHGGRPRSGRWSMSGPSSTSTSARSRGSATCRSSRTAATMMGASNPHPHCQIWATATPAE